jgi:uncharacterized protein (DUF2236 family)
MARFADDDPIRRVNREGVLLLGGGRALLMQVAHPAVAQGVAEHSDFESDPWSRLVGTLEAMYTIVFGTDEQAERMAAVVHAVHERVTGDGYRANDPALLCWVNATLFDTGLRMYSTLIGPLSTADQEAYYRQASEVAELLGCPRSEQPPDLASFRDYMRTMVGTLEVTPPARKVSAAIWRPDLPVPAPLTGPPFALAKFVTAGMLPAPLRHQYGLVWDRRRKAALVRALAAARVAYPLLPRPLREAPKSYFLSRAA